MGVLENVLRETVKRASSVWPEEGPHPHGDRMVTSESLRCCCNEKRLGLSCFVPGARIRTDWYMLQESSFLAYFIKELSKDVICLINGESYLPKCKVFVPKTLSVFPSHKRKTTCFAFEVVAESPTRLPVDAKTLWPWNAYFSPGTSKHQEHPEGFPSLSG